MLSLSLLTSGQPKPGSGCCSASTREAFGPPGTCSSTNAGNQRPRRPDGRSQPMSNGTQWWASILQPRAFPVLAGSNQAHEGAGTCRRRPGASSTMVPSSAPRTAAPNSAPLHSDQNTPSPDSRNAFRSTAASTASPAGHDRHRPTPLTEMTERMSAGVPQAKRDHCDRAANGRASTWPTRSSSQWRISRWTPMFQFITVDGDHRCRSLGTWIDAIPKGGMNRCESSCGLWRHYYDDSLCYQKSCCAAPGLSWLLRWSAGRAMASRCGNICRWKPVSFPTIPRRLLRPDPGGRRSVLRFLTPPAKRALAGAVPIVFNLLRVRTESRSPPTWRRSWCRLFFFFC